MDEIVSAVYYEGVVLIFTKNGLIYELARDRNTAEITVRIATQINLGVHR